MARTRAAAAAAPPPPAVAAAAVAAPPPEVEDSDDEHQPVPPPPPPVPVPPAPGAAVGAVVALAPVVPVVPANRLWPTIVEELEFEDGSFAAALAEQYKHVKWGAALAPTATFIRLTDVVPYSSQHVLEYYGHSPDLHYYRPIEERWFDCRF